MLPQKYQWTSFKDRTNLKGRSRGKNMQDVDNSLKAYWSSLPQGPGAAIGALFELLKACNSWLKLKKDKNDKGGSDHFQTRWDEVKDLANAAFVECQQMLLVFNANVSRGQIDYERKKLRSMSQPRKATKQLDGGYSRERDLWLKSKKQASPISGTTLHETIQALTDPNKPAYDDAAARQYGGNKSVNKNFDSMTMKDWQAIEGLMAKLSAPPSKTHVAFLRKSARIAYMAMVSNGLLVKNNGTPWDTAAWDVAFAQDEYGNLFIGEASIESATERLNHSTMLAGKGVLCAGTLQINAGRLTKFNNNSGHYKPTGQHVYQGLLALQDEHADLSQTAVTIKISDHHGFGDLTVAEVIAAQGQFTQPHPKYY